MPKRYNTPHRSHVIKTRLTDEEYANFTARLAPLEKSLKNIFGFFKKHFRFCPCFSPISERAKHDKKKGGLRP